MGGVLKILVIGESCLDVFVYGTVDRICPEAPVPVFCPTHEVQNRGMAGNVIENVMAMRPDAEVKYITNQHHWEKMRKVRFIEHRSNQMLMRMDEDQSLYPIDNIESFEDDIASADLVLVSDYNKGLLTEEVIRKIPQLAKGVTILDTKKSFDVTKAHVMYGYTLIKLNKKEYDSMGAMDVQGMFYGKTIITLGREGAMFEGNIYPSENPTDTIDVSGAGDTFLAALGIKYVETKDVVEAIKYANEMCSIVVRKKGVSTP